MKALIIICFAPLFSFGQAKILHYTETSGFDHGTREVSLAMFQEIMAGYFQIVDDQTGDEFNTLSNLEQYALIVFSNTSGNNILNAAQRANFESYILNGGSFMGIHAASDTYRHSTANGNNTGSWDFYAELVGASVQQNPNHVAGTPQYEMTHTSAHNSLTSIPDPWVKNEEYYYWENGYYNPNNNAILEVEETVGPNNMVNSYDEPRPMSWYRELYQGGQMFYTALGHAASNYTSDQNFRAHIRDAIFALVDVSTEIENFDESPRLNIDRIGSELGVFIENEPPTQLKIYDMLGRECDYTNNSPYLNIEKLPAGLYLLEASGEKSTVFRKIYID